MSFTVDDLVTMTFLILALRLEFRSLSETRSGRTPYRPFCEQETVECISFGNGCEISLFIVSRLSGFVSVLSRDSRTDIVAVSKLLSLA
jgi:hypothetical protein